MHIQLTTHNYQIWQVEKTLVDLRYLVFVFKFLIFTFAMEQILGSWFPLSQYHSFQHFVGAMHWVFVSSPQQQSSYVEILIP